MSHVIHSYLVRNAPSVAGYVSAQLTVNGPRRDLFMDRKSLQRRWQSIGDLEYFQEARKLEDSYAFAT